MSNRLYIGNNKIDLDESIAIPLSYSIADFKKPESRKRNVSRTILLPSTENNKRVFSSAYELSLTDTGDNLGFDFNPNIRVKARYNKNGKDIFNGLCRLLEVKLLNGNYYFEIVLFSDFVNIIKQMSDVLVSELNWTEYDHNLTLGLVEDSWDTSVSVNGLQVLNYDAISGKPLGFGYWYPIADYGYNSSLFTYNLNDLVPHIYVKETFEKCFESLGYTIDSDFFDTDMFRALTWGFGGGKKNMIPPQEKTNRQTNIRFDGVISRSGYYYYNGGYYSLHDFSDTVLTDLYSQYNSTNGRIKVQKSGSYKLNLDCDILITETLPVGVSAIGGRARVEVIKNNSIVSYTTWQWIPSNGVAQNFTRNQDFNLSLIAGDEVEVKTKVEVFGGAASSNFVSVVDVDYNNNFNINLTSEDGVYLEGDTMSLSRFIPKMKNSDFVKGIITMFNLYVSEPDDDNIIKIEPLLEYYEGEDNWTELLDHSKEISIKPASVEGAKFYNFKFTEDNDYYNKKYFDTYRERYGDYNYDSNNEYSSNEIDFVVPFAQTCPVKVSGISNLVIPRIINIDEDTKIVTEYKGKPRIYFNNGLQSATISINDSTGLNTFTTYPQAHHSYGDINNLTFDLNFKKPENFYYTFSYFKNNNLFSKYQRLSIIEQTSIDAKILKAYFNLNQNDIDSEMFRRLVNINGVLYRKNVVTDFDALGNETTKVELYKVIETTEINEEEIPNPKVIPTTPDRDSVPIIRNPKGVGVGVPILSGGKNTGLVDVPLKFPMRAPTFV